MSRGLSLRSRLTAAIVVVTAIVSALAVILGMAALRDNVRDAAVDEQLEWASDLGIGLDTVFLDGGLLQDDFVDDRLEEQGFLFEVLGDAGNSAFGADLQEINDFEATYVRSVIDQFDLHPVLVDEFGSTGGDIVLLLSTGNFAVLDDLGGTELLAVPPSNTVVAAASIADIGGSIFDSGAISQDQRQFEFASTTLDQMTIGIVVDVTEGYRALDEVADALWLSAVFLTLSAATAAWLLIGRALAPVDAITRRVAEITAGNLSERVPIPSREDEIGVLALTMNTMLGRLEASDLRRRQFISDASHELRTPVAVLQSEAEVARRCPDTTTVDQLSDVVLSESDRLGRMIEDLLALARDDEAESAAGPREGSTLGDVDVDEVVLAESRRSRRVAVDRSGVSAGRIAGRTDHLERAIAHLLDNATRHASERVAVGVATQGGEVVCWVDDDGSGISEKDRQRVFERFVRLDDARDRDRGGAGLGLAVVRSTIESMGGTVDAIDSPLGGIRFEIRWPAV